MRTRYAIAVAGLALLTALIVKTTAVGDRQRDEALAAAQGHLELPDDPFIAVDRDAMPRSEGRRVTTGVFTSVQVNVDGLGNNIVGDAANEPSLAVDPTDPSKMAIGWRQFDTVTSNFRQAGWGYTTDGGQSWTFPGSLDAGLFRSDPVVEADSTGTFYYYSLGVPGGAFVNDTFRSTDGGQTWGPPIFACGGDKAWITADRSGGIGDGHLYAFWTDIFSCPGATGNFNRSTDGAFNWDPELPVPNTIQWGTLDVGSDGVLYLIGRDPGGGIWVVQSANAQVAGETVVFDTFDLVDLGGSLSSGSGPNPGGLLGQAWVGVNPVNDEIYALGSVNPPGGDPLDVNFSRSSDGGATWSAPVRVHTDATGYQWFGTMSVAPNGRIDAVWNDTRNAGGGLASELFYSFSIDGGRSWSADVALSPPWDPLIGHPQQNKIGDYYDMVSFDDAAHLAWAATFNGEQDVYYLRIGGDTIFEDGFESGDTTAWPETVP